MLCIERMVQPKLHNSKRAPKEVLTYMLFCCYHLASQSYGQRYIAVYSAEITSRPSGIKYEEAKKHIYEHLHGGRLLLYSGIFAFLIYFIIQCICLPYLFSRTSCNRLFMVSRQTLV